MQSTLLICVNYKNYSLTENFLTSLKRFLNEIDVVVVDNESDDFFFLHLKEKFEEYNNIYFFSHPDNIGYLGGINYGYMNADNTEKYSNIIVSNNDILINDNFFFKKLDKLSNLDEVGIIAPQVLIKGKLSKQNPYITNKKWWHKFYHSFFYSTFFLYKLRTLLSNYRIDLSQEPREEINIYAAHGSFMIIRNIFFKRGGSLKYCKILYGEEEFLANQCVKQNLLIRFVPSLKVIHQEHQSTGNMITHSKFQQQRESFFYNYF